MSVKSTLTRWLTGDIAILRTRALFRKSMTRLRVLLAEQRVEQATELLPGAHVLTSSFGAQAAVMLHLVNQVIPKIPVVLIDTGYLFPETYRFVDDLTAGSNSI
jgi:3'-phosphoadenosine 5'-phosphosulfate sulfotransferase (PAPS reductase)/FAD synthetase